MSRGEMSLGEKRLSSLTNLKRKRLHHASRFSLKNRRKKVGERKKSNAFCWPIDQFDAAASMISSAAEEEASSRTFPLRRIIKNDLTA